MFIVSTFLQPPPNHSVGQVAIGFEGDSKTEILANSRALPRVSPIRPHEEMGLPISSQLSGIPWKKCVL